MTDRRDRAGGYSGTRDGADMAPPAHPPPDEIRVLPSVRAAVDITVDPGANVHMTVEGPHRVVERTVASLADAITEEIER